MTQSASHNEQAVPKYGFLPFVLPFVLFMLIGSWEPKFAAETDQPASTDSASAEADENGSAAEPTTSDADQEQPPAKTARYLWVYAVKILVTSGLLVFFFPIYLKQFPFPPFFKGGLGGFLSVSSLSVLVGVIGVILWVGICWLEIELLLFDWIGLNSDWVARSQFNPFDVFAADWLTAVFLTLRFTGLVVVVPICEELFLRGFLMRFVEDGDWWKVSLSRLSTKALLVAPLYGALTHPGEILAAVVWFSLVNWLMKRTGSLWDCIVAHAITNLLLGLYIIFFAQWQLW